MDSTAKVELLAKRCNDLFTDMSRLRLENAKNKKRADQLQKEKDHGRTELSKTVTLREKLEKLCRELQRENNRLKVSDSRRLRLALNLDASILKLLIWDWGSRISARCLKIYLGRLKYWHSFSGREQDFARLRKGKSRGLGQQVWGYSVYATGLATR